MQCATCSHDNPGDARFCNSCGTRLPESPLPSAGSIEISVQRDLSVGNDLVGRDKVHNQNTFIINYGSTPTSPAPGPQVGARERYLSHLINANKTLRLQGIRAGNQPVSVNLEKVYVSLRIRSSAEGRRDQSHSEIQTTPLTDSDAGTQSVPQALKRHRWLVIVGDPGCGKTTLQAYLTLTYARSAQGPDDLVKKRLWLDEGQYLPILLPLRSLGGHLRDRHPNPAADGPALLLDYLNTYYQNQAIPLPEGFFAVPLDKGQAVVLLDGMDEVADRDLRTRVARLIEKFALRYPDNRIVITSRKVGYEGSARLSEGFGLVEVQEFTTPEVRQFLRDWTRVLESTLAGEVTAEVLHQADGQADALIAAIERNPRIAELAVNPLLLTVIALVHRQRAKLPSRRSELYAEAVGVLLGNWDEAKDGIQPTLEVAGKPLDAIDRRTILEPVAYWMHEQRLREIDRQDLWPLLHPSFAKLTGNDPSATRRAVQSFLELIDQRSGLFVARGLGTYGFAHLTFQEYLAARSLSDRQDSEALVQQRLGDPWWREVLFLAPGSTESKRRASDLIQAMLGAPADSARLDHLVLAAECVLDVGEVRVEGDLLGEIRRRLKVIAEAPEPTDNFQRREWILSRVSAQNALARIESGELAPRYWRAGTGEPDWVTISAGEFWMGSPGTDQEAYDDEKPQHRVFLKAYAIARVPITNAQYALYVTGARIDPPLHWRGGQPPPGKDDHPVVNVNWEDAQGYCRWLSEKLGQEVRLPTEAQWEKAARGDQDQRRFPWGDAWGELRCNSSELGLGDTSPVGLFLSSASPAGVLDLSGNVFEWCQSGFKLYPYVAEDGREELLHAGLRTLRGGSLNNKLRLSRCACRYVGSLPGSRHDSNGFRVVLVSPGSY